MMQRINNRRLTVLLWLIAGLLLAGAGYCVVSAGSTYDALAQKYTYIYNASDSAWVNQNITIEGGFYTTAEIGSVQTNVADLSGVEAMVFRAENPNSADFVWNLGIRDARMNVHNNEWYMSGAGSALFVPDNGHAYWAVSGRVPAGFSGTVVLPFKTLLYDGMDTYPQRYNSHNNPVFKMRFSQNASGLYAEGEGETIQSFPTATMNRYMTVYVASASNQNVTQTVTLENIHWITNSDARNFDYYLGQLEAFDSAAIGAELNAVDMDGAIAFSVAAGSASGSITFHQQSGGGGAVSANALDGSVGLAVRMQNIGDATLGFEMTVHESSSEQLFLFSYDRMLSLPFIHLDGTVDTVTARGRVFLPAGYNGTLIIPYSSLALAANPNAGTSFFSSVNGRLNGNIWQLRFYVHTDGLAHEFAVAEVAQLYAHYNPVSEKVGYDVVQMKTQAGGSDVHYVKNPDSWAIPAGFTKQVISGVRTLVLLETEDEQPAEKPIASLSRDRYCYGERSLLTIPKRTGKIVYRVLLNGEDMTARLSEEDDIYTLTLCNTENGENGSDTVSLTYYTGFGVRYETNGGVNSDKNASTYSMLNAGETALPLYSPVRANHRFIGWYNRLEFSHEDAVIITELDYEKLAELGYNNEELTLYARWDDSYTVRIYEGSGLLASCVVRMGEALTNGNISELAQPGFTYQLFADNALTQVVSLPAAFSAVDVKLYVVYTPIQYQVRFQTLGGGSIESQSLIYCSTAKEPACIVREGYIFEGWYLEDDYIVAYDFSSAVTRDLVLYAKWATVPTGAALSPLRTPMIIMISISGASLLALSGLLIWALKSKSKEKKRM